MRSPLRPLLSLSTGEAPKSGYAKLRHLSDDTLLFQLTRTQSYKGLSCSLVAPSHIGYRSVYY